ncbi:hypothetical protein CAPTEDRAFT_195409 [Capitella teleta]|uniref:Uncharacterized protein n=1 Tax=Capitella teleta TaxID=283909 RepID=R7T7G1_CAPTE|nr:hypothetical protein CAPTEDRAFT_195409 [Capitella teleta]|eukprot:ELT89589.1 hypothetical protein CAPTEDRAFT_195409 [Capitella teleta]
MHQLQTRPLLCTWSLYLSHVEGQLMCSCPDHANDLIEYHSQIILALEIAASRCIPHRRKKGLAGWSTLVNPLKEDAIFWNKIWMDCGRANSGWVYNIRRKTRAKYRQAVRFVLNNQDKLSAERMAQALERNASRDLWQEVSRRKGGSSPSTESIDDVEGNEQVRILFRDKYDELYSSVSYDKQEMKQLCFDVDREASLICGMGKCSSKHNFTALDVRKAVKKLKGGKSDARPSISSDNFIKACDELCVHLSLFLSALLTSSLAPPAMLESVLVPIPKSRKNQSALGNNLRYVAETLRTTPTGVADFKLNTGKDIITTKIKYSEDIVCAAYCILELRDMRLGYLSSALNCTECTALSFLLCTKPESL